MSGFAGAVLGGSFSEEIFRCGQGKFLHVPFGKLLEFETLAVGLAVVGPKGPVFCVTGRPRGTQRGSNQAFSLGGDHED